MLPVYSPISSDTPVQRTLGTRQGHASPGKQLNRAAKRENRKNVSREASDLAGLRWKSRPQTMHR